MIVSTKSGSGAAKAFYDTHIARLLGKYGLKEADYSTHITQTEQSVSEFTKDVFAREALQGQALLLIVLSGDGGIIDILNGLAPIASRKGYKAPLVAVLPCGTANALLHSARIDSDDTFGLGTLTNGKAKTLPNFNVR